MFLHFGHSMGLNRLMTMVDFLKKKNPFPSHFVIYDLCLVTFKK